MVQWDSSSGWSSGGLLEKQGKKWGGGIAATETSSGPNPEAFIWYGEDTGVLFAPSFTPSFGAFTGGTIPKTRIHGGAGVYVTVTSASECRQ
jgi:hypothetical protein